LKNIAKNNPGWKFYRFHMVERTLHDVPMEYIANGIHGIPMAETWIGQQRARFTGPWKPRGFGICPDAYKSMFKAICEEYKLVCDTTDYIPTIDYSLFDIQKIDDFLSSIRRPCVIVSNGDVLSGQAPNFSMDPIVEKLKSYFTVVTTKNRKQEGEYYIGDIVKREDEDLSELSYLSTKAYAIIGRSSGPYIFSVVKENFNGKLRMICIANDEGGLYWENANNDYWIPSSDGMNIILDKVMDILRR
jgi:hypothetical protein